MLFDLNNEFQLSKTQLAQGCTSALQQIVLLTGNKGLDMLCAASWDLILAMSDSCIICTVCTRLKYLNNYSMDCHEFLDKY